MSEDFDGSEERHAYQCDRHGAPRHYCGCPEDGTMSKKKLRIYVASSWRNALQPAIVTILRGCGHEVYDFRHPAPGSSGFNWREIDPDWERWTPAQYREALKHPIARAGYALDVGALRACDACVLVLPSGRSASWEFGYAMGQGKRGVVVQFDGVEPELMYSEAEIVTNVNELFDAFGEPECEE